MATPSFNLKRSPAGFVLAYWVVAIIFFQAGRIIFLVFNYPGVKETGITNVIPAAWYGFRMDASMSAYLTLPVLLICLVAIFFKKLQAPVVYIIYTGIILFLVLLLMAADLGLFDAWGFRLDATPMAYLKSPKEVWASISHLPIFSGGLVLIVIFILLMIFFSRKIRKAVKNLTVHNKFIHALILVVLAAASIIPLRGGFQLAPINQSSVYFSKFHFANQAALNPVWNLMYSLNHSAGSSENPYVAIEAEEVKKITDSLFAVQPLQAD